MILQKNITIPIHRYRNYYESRNYFIPQYKNSIGKWTVKIGSTIKIKLQDLPKGSNIKVLCQCDNPDCLSKPKLIAYKDYNKYIQNTGKYLCKQCSFQSAERRAKISQSSSKHRLSDKTKEKIGLAHKGKIVSEAIKNKQSQIMKGKNNPNYNHNLTDDERKLSYKRFFVSGYTAWRRLVKQRDNYTCQCCKYVGYKYDGTMIAHHINNFSNFKELRTNVDNGITLCKDCHKKLHNIYGNKTNEKNFQNFMNS